MGRIKRIVDVDFWTDEKVIELFSPEDKLFFIYLLTNPHTTQLGIYPISKKVMAFEIGYSIDAINVLLDRFENKYGLIKYKNGEMAIKNSLRHSIVKGGKPVEDLLVKEISAVKTKSLLKWVYESVKGSTDLNETVKKVLPMLNGNDNGNDNDNDESSNDSTDESSHESSKRFSPPTMEEVKAYCQERNNGVDPNKWYDFYASKGWMVGKNKMKDWKASVRTWEKDKPKQEEEEISFRELARKNGWNV